MNISSVHIKNLLSFKDENINLTNTNIIVGTNGVGKSNFIELVYSLLNNVNYISDTDMYHPFNDDNHSSIEIKLQIDDPLANYFSSLLIIDKVINEGMKKFHSYDYQNLERVEYFINKIDIIIFGNDSMYEIKDNNDDEIINNTLHKIKNMLKLIRIQFDIKWSSWRFISNIFIGSDDEFILDAHTDLLNNMFSIDNIQEYLFCDKNISKTKNIKREDFVGKITNMRIMKLLSNQFTNYCKNNCKNKNNITEWEFKTILFNYIKLNVKLVKLENERLDKINYYLDVISNDEFYQNIKDKFKKITNKDFMINRFKKINNNEATFEYDFYIKDIKNGISKNYKCSLGERELIDFLINFYSKDVDILLIDEPCVHLSYQNKDAFRNEILECKDNNKQIILITHDHRLISETTCENIVLFKMTDNNGTVVKSINKIFNTHKSVEIQIDNNKDQVTESIFNEDIPYNNTNMHSIGIYDIENQNKIELNEGTKKLMFDHKEIFFAKKCLLVEGYFDYKFMKQFLKVLKLNDYLIIDMRTGSSSLYKILNALDIDFKCIYDLDILNGKKKKMFFKDINIYKINKFIKDRKINNKYNKIIYEHVKKISINNENINKIKNTSDKLLILQKIFLTSLIKNINHVGDHIILERQCDLDNDVTFFRKINNNNNNYNDLINELNKKQFSVKLIDIMHLFDKELTMYVYNNIDNIDIDEYVTALLNNFLEPVPNLQYEKELITLNDIIIDMNKYSKYHVWKFEEKNQYCDLEGFCRVFFDDMTFSKKRWKQLSDHKIYNKIRLQFGIVENAEYNIDNILDKYKKNNNQNKIDLLSNFNFLIKNVITDCNINICVDKAIEQLKINTNQPIIDFIEFLQR